MDNIMLDLETLGTVITQIGAVYFDWTGKTGETFLVNVNIKSCLDRGLEIKYKERSSLGIDKVFPNLRFKAVVSRVVSFKGGKGLISMIPSLIAFSIPTLLRTKSNFLQERVTYSDDSGLEFVGICGKNDNRFIFCFFKKGSSDVG